jgi:hypothetical protein
MRRSFFCSCAISLLLCAFSAGCRDREVTSYRIPKEKDPELPSAAANAEPVSPPAANNPMAATPVATANGANLEWTAPAHWISKPAAQMRKATYAVNGDAGETADLSITAFTGPTGGELANVNRWRTQIQLSALNEAEAAGAITRFEANGLGFAVVDFTGAGATPQRVLAAIVPFGSATWFFKLSGPAPLIAREQAAFNAFLKTVRAPAGTP